MSSRRGLSADHHCTQPAETEQHTRHTMPRRRVGIGFGGVDAQQRPVGRRQLDELHRRQRGAIALAADDELLHLPAAGRGNASQQLARGVGADVVHSNKFGLQVLELLPQRQCRLARDKQFAFMGVDLAPDVAAFGGEIVFFVAQELCGQRRLGAGGLPGVWGRGRRRRI
jgi:hypothetical protein